MTREIRLIGRGSAKAVFVGFVALASAPIYAANECATWPEVCRDLQKFRRERQIQDANRTQASFCADCSPVISGLLSKLTSIKDLVSPGRSYSTDKFLRCLSSEAEALKPLRNQDLKVILDALSKLGVTEVSVASLDRILLSPAGDINMTKSIMKSSGGPYPYYRDYALTGPIQNLEEAYTGERVVEGGPTLKRYDTSIRAYLQTLGQSSRVFQSLREHALSGNASESGHARLSPSTNRLAMTPAMSKLILFEILRDRLKDEGGRLQEILSSMKLKFDYINPLSPTVVNVNSFTIHDGYYLGAQPEHDPLLSKPLASTGSDCTTLIQKCQARAGLVPPDGFKLLSGRLAAMTDPGADRTFEDMDQYRSLFRAEPFQCEAQLKLGDVIAFNGHAFVFGGYEPDSSGALQMTTFEAVAGEHRTYGKFNRLIYNDSSCGPPILSSAGQVPATIIRVNR